MVDAQNKIDNADGLDEAIAHLRRMAHQSNSKRKDEAIQRLVEIGEPAVAPLMHVWRNDDQFARRLASHAISSLGDVAIDDIATMLNDVELRDQASLVLRDMGTGRSRKVLRDALTSGIDRTYSRQKLADNEYGLLIHAYGMILLAASMIISSLNFKSKIAQVMFFVGLATSIVPRLVSYNQVTNFRRNALRAIIEGNDGWKIAYLSRYINEKDPVLGKAIREALLIGLPAVNATDRPHFSPEAMQALMTALDGRNTPLTLAILKALEQIGDERAVERVEKLARTAKSREVRLAAEDCLPALRASASNVRLANTLLRPAESPPDATLLSPASATESQVETLLRPVGSDEVETLNTQHG